MSSLLTSSQNARVFAKAEHYARELATFEGTRLRGFRFQAAPFSRVTFPRAIQADTSRSLLSPQ